MHALITIRTP